MSTIGQDVRFAIRGLRKAPAFPLAAIATLALGIGATTAIFSTLNAVLLKPLPYPNPQDLYNIRTTLIDGRVTTGLVSGGEIFRLNDPNLSIDVLKQLKVDNQAIVLTRSEQEASLKSLGRLLRQLEGVPVHRAGAVGEQHAQVAIPLF